MSDKISIFRVFDFLENWEYSIATKKYKDIKKRSKDKRMHFDIEENLFKVFYGKDSFNRQCEYCLIHELDIEEAIFRNQIHTQRARGLGMEIDRKNPSEGYVYKDPRNNNIAMCCYWCNNAKTDEFNESEFKSIADGIRKVWAERLKKF